MNLDASAWHQRFLQQALWTQELRSYFYGQIELGRAGRILDVGCGTGALVPELLAGSAARVCGVDLNPGFLALARQGEEQPPDAGGRRLSLVRGDARALPFASQSFDISLCHFLLLWVAGPLEVVTEMSRVTRPGGAVLALAEPDYGGRIDYPPQLEPLGRAQAEALRRQGADPQIGRRLSSIFSRAGLARVEVGVLGGQWRDAPSSASQLSEWTVLRSDLEGWIPGKVLEAYQAIEAQAWEQGERVLFVPTFYAWGRVVEREA